MGIQLTMMGERQRKRFIARQKLEILREWESTGNGVDVSRRHGIHPMTLYRWRRRLEQGAAGFCPPSRKQDSVSRRVPAQRGKNQTEKKARADS